jgi:hypothetical protein
MYRRLFVTIVLSLATSSSALAQGAAAWEIHPDVLLDGTDVPYGETIGSPSVVYNTRNSTYYMFFESRLPTVDPDCPAGLWAIGAATSSDGLTWTVRSTAAIEPDPDAANPTFHSCVAAHPGAIYRETPQGGIIEVFFKGEQADDACATVVQPWGCEQYTGIGRYRLRFDLAGNFVDQTLFDEPVLERSTTFGYPKPLRFTDSTGQTAWLLSYGAYPHIDLATSPTAAGPWTERGTILDASTTMVSWAEDEFFNSALACRDSGSLPFETLVGGRTNQGGAVQSGAVGKAIATTGQPGSWVLSALPQFEITNDDEFRHWDVLRIGAIDYTLWFDEKDANGDNQIRVASTIPTFTWNNADVYDKHCQE